MAETVKKSRIEEMQEPSDDEEEKVKEVIKLEFNNITTNGNQDDSIYDEVCPINSNERFLFEERNVYADTNGVSLKNKLNDAHDEILHPEENPLEDFEENLAKKQSPQNTTEEVIYDEVKTIRPVLQLPTTCLTDMSDTIDEEDVQDTKGSVKDRMFLSTDDTSCLLFTQTVTSPMLTPSEENIDFLKGFQRQSSQNTASTSENTQSENIALSKIEDADQQNEDITESSNISDKLDVEYENIQQINTEGDISEVDNLGPSTLDINQVEMEQEKCDTAQNENIYEAIEDDGDDRQEQIYENMEILRKQSQVSLTDKQKSTKEFLERERVEEEKNRYEENIYENIEDTEEEEIELSNAESIEELQSDAPEKSIPDVCLEANEKLDSQSKCSQKEYVEEEIEENKSQSPIPQSDKGEWQIKQEEYSNEIVEMLPNEPEIVEHEEDCSFEEEKKQHLSSQVIEIAEYDRRELEANTPVENKNGKLENECTITDSDVDDKSLDNPSKMVDALKTKFLTNTTAEIVKTASIEKNELNQLKTVDIMKQINKFESKSPSKTDEDDDESNISKSSFNKFDALQKKNVLHVRSSDSSTAQEKFNGAAPIDNTNCKACGKVVFQMEQIKAEKSVWHKNCFRCQECSKQLTVDTYQSNEGTVYCKPHFKSLFAPKAVEDEAPPSDKPDLGLEELQSLNVRERFQVFEHYEENQNSNVERGQVSVKRSPSILSKLAKFQSKGMDVGVTDDSLNGIPIEESSSEEEQEEEEEEIPEGEDADLIRAKKAQKEKPFHFTNMSDVKNKWEHGEQNSKDMRREERKQEIQSIRDRLFMGKQGKMKEAYQQAVMESESCTNIRKAMSPPPEACDTRTLKEKFEKGDAYEEKREGNKEADDMSVFESGISKKSRSIFLELDANASKAPQLSPVSPPKGGSEVKKAREAESPEREVYRDPDIVRAAEQVEDSVIAQESHTTTKILNKFRQMEESMQREPLPLGPKPLKRFTPPPEPTRQESSSEGEATESEEESEEFEEVDQSKMQDADLLEAQKAARARQLRAKFEKWEAKEIKREQQQQVNIIEEIGDEQAQIESTKALRARFESLKESQSQVQNSPKVKVNRFVDTTSTLEVCYGCKERVYPLEKISIHEQTYHKKCFKCKECNTVLRMDSYTYNQGLLYCIPHFKRLFIAKGNYDTAFGLEQRKEKWNTTVA